MTAGAPIATSRFRDLMAGRLTCCCSRAFAECSLQRIWRDPAIAARHAVTLPIASYELCGKALLGRDDQITPLI